MEGDTQIAGILTYQEALDFLSCNMGISNATDLLSRDPLALLHELSIKHSERMPFQNITNLSLPIGGIALPGMDAIKSDNLSGRGGLCYGLNRFLFELLYALGYKAHLTIGCVRNPDDHVVVIISALPNGDTAMTYMFDNGYGFPHHRPVPLHFDVESPVYNLGHTLFKLTREGDLYTRWVAKQGNLFVSAAEYEKAREAEESYDWVRSFSFTTKPASIEAIRNGVACPYEIGFGTSGTLRFILVQGVFLHLIEDSDKSIPQLNVKHHQIGPSGTSTTQLESVGDVIACCRRLCPAISEHELSIALEHLAYYKRIFVEEASK